MTAMILTCIDVELHDDYAVVTLQASSTNSTNYIAGDIGFTIFLSDVDKYVVGSKYDLNLNKVS